MSASKRRRVLVTDTSVVLASLVHGDPGIVRECRSRIEESGEAVGHVIAEAYARITSMPGGLRLSPSSAWTLLGDMFPGEPMVLSGAGYLRILGLMADIGIPGGAVYDCLIAETAREHNAVLVSLDKRAAQHYAAVGAEFELL